jgi:hypothetical protein
MIRIPNIENLPAVADEATWGLTHRLESPDLLPRRKAW